MSVASEIERIKTNIANAYTEIENKGVVTTGAKNSDNLASTISAIQTGGTGGGSNIEKGIKINGYDSDGYATEVEVVGMDVIPDRYLYMATYEGGWAVRANFKLGNNITNIGAYNFYNTKLSELNLPDSVTYLGNYCFAGSTTLTKLKLPASLTGVGEFCFNSNNIEILDFPEGITGFPQKVFYGCSTKVIIFRGAITDLGQECFNKVKGLDAIIFTKRRNYPYYPRCQDRTFYSGTIRAIYVPDEDVNAYKGGTNISKMSSVIKPLSELPEEYKELL